MKANKMYYASSKDSDRLGISPIRSDLLFFAHRGAKNSCFFMHTAKTLIRLDGCPAWSESAGHTYHFVSVYVRHSHPMGLVTRKPVFGVSDKVSFKPVSSATETS